MPIRRGDKLYFRVTDTLVAEVSPDETIRWIEMDPIAHESTYGYTRASYYQNVEKYARKRTAVGVFPGLARMSRNCESKNEPE